MVLKERMEKGRDRSLDGVTGQLTYFAHAHSILGNIKSGELRYCIYCTSVLQVLKWQGAQIKK